MGFRNVIHEVASTPFYRDHPREALAFLAARSLLFRRRTDPRDFLLGLGIKDLDLLQRDFEHRAPVFSEVQTAAHKAGCGRPGICSDDGFILYCLIRWLRPAYVIETGVAAGISTTFLLAALADNQEGCLWSIELPPAHVENHKMADGRVYAWPAHGVGWVIPQDLIHTMEGRWHLVLQDIREALPTLLTKLPRVEMFFHDDLHTPDHMYWELASVWPHLVPGGMLVSDDINQAWIKFCKMHGYADRAYVNVMGLGALRKS